MRAALVELVNHLPSLKVCFCFSFTLEEVGGGSKKGADAQQTEYGHEPQSLIGNLDLRVKWNAIGLENWMGWGMDRR